MLLYLLWMSISMDKYIRTQYSIIIIIVLLNIYLSQHLWKMDKLDSARLYRV